jgi:hypothetical protein
MPKHKFKNLIRGGRKVEIDEDIAPLIEKMWKLGINTNNSCQADCSFSCKHKCKIKKLKSGDEYFDVIKTKKCYNNVWISFDSIKDVELLYDSVAEYDKAFDSMYSRMNCGRFVETANNYNNPPDSWAFSFYFRNDGGKLKKNKFVMSPQITFPRIHIPYIEGRLQLVIDKKTKGKL